MNALADADLSEAPDHPVLDRPWAYDIVGVRFMADPCGAPHGTLDLHLAKDGTALTLRFSRAHELQIDAGFPHSHMGLEILDVGFLGREHSRIRVEGFEDAPGIRFWAQEVIRVET